MALYRKYRPATFAEVVGQEHVTEPLSAALESGRINHAYLFSGPRGCGKTSSARILARSLNCVEGPTASPCGVCRSCVALGPGGTGNLDVIELDAASHGGVEDTRDLRDKAFYAPAESRYRVFIVDEAHMVSNAGFNALLKIVEEPPEHLIFVFATTEPEKVLPTIRSRTHHYPFRLLPPTVMRGLLDRICAQEGVTVEDAVFPLAIRAGGGSPRDTLSVLDQLLAGAGEGGITYARALPLLGVTDVALIDDAVDALAVDDGATLFQTVNRLVEAGHDPRRFAADLLDRMRDLIVIKSVPDAGEKGIVDAPGDILEYMRDEADRIGLATLTRYAEVIHDSLNDMRGATAPRLLLEVMCARLLLPAATDEVSGMLQRIEKLEQGIAPVGGAGGAGPSGGAAQGDARQGGAAQGDARQGEAASRFVRPSQRAAAAPPAAEQPAAVPEPEAVPPAAAPKPEASQPPEVTQPPARATPPPAPVTSPPVSQAASEEAAPVAPVQKANETPQEPAESKKADAAPEPAKPEPEPAEPDNEPRPAAAEEGGHLAGETKRSAETPAAQAEPTPDSRRPDATAMRAAWSEVRAAIRKRSRTVEVMLSAAVVKRVDDDTVVLTHPAAPLAARLAEPHNAQLIREAVSAVYGGEWRLVVENDTGPAAAGGPPQQGAGQTARRQRERSAPQEFSRRSKAVRSDSDAESPPRDADRPVGAGHSEGSAETDFPRPRDEDAPPESDLPGDPYDEAAAEEEMMADAAAGPGETTERRDPEEAAVELLRGTLGATPLDG